MTNVPTNSHGEIVNVNEADQFQLAKSQFECGYFACAMARSMAPIGKPPMLSIQQIINDAEQWYAQYDGTDAITNVNGMTEQQEYDLLHQIGLHYQATSTDVNVVKQWLKVGYPVIVVPMEASVHDEALGDTNPYPWNPSGSHVIFATGVASDGSLLVRDSANCTNLSDPNSLRPGPRRYDAAKLQIISATVAVPPWMPRPTSAMPPIEPPIQAFPDLHVPQGWNDNGTMLTAPNGGKAILGFRGYILMHNWDPADMPISGEEGADPVEIGYSQPDGSNAGTRLICMYSELCWTSKRGVYKASVGRELSIALQRLAVATTPPAPSSQDPAKP